MRTFLTLALAVAFGCGGKKDADGPEQPEVVASLRDVGAMLASGTNAGRGPRSLGELEKVREMFPRGYKAVDEGSVIVFWQNPMMGEGAIAAGADTSTAKAAACEKKAITEGGYALLTNGVVQQMTADELAKRK